MDPHVETELLAYIDGELNAPDRARVEAHLASCPRCTAERERLQALRRELGATFDAALSPVRLSRAAADRIRQRLRARLEPRPWFGLWRRRGLIAQALSAVLVLVFALNATALLGVPPLPAPHETLVLGYDQLAPGSQAALRVIVRSAPGAEQEGEPIAGAEVIVRVERAPGPAKILYTGQTDTSGTANVAFTVPEDLAGTADLVVETASEGGRDRIVRPIVIARAYKLFLTSDKPAYRPGQTVHLRALVLDTADLRPVEAQDVELALIGPASGVPMRRHTASTSEFGVAAFDFPLPQSTAHGQYTLRAKIGETISERTVTVSDYVLPPFRVDLETDRAFYAPGERVTGSVQAAYFFGQPVAGGEVILRGYTDAARKTAAIIVLGETDAEGAFAFTFVLPPTFGTAASGQPVYLELEAEVMDDAGQRSGARRPLPVAAQPILISAVPESGVIKPGVENTIYIMTAYADGRTAETTLTVRTEEGTVTQATDPYGLAEFRYVPRGVSPRLEVRAQDAAGASASAEFRFPADLAPQVLLLRAERAAYEVGDTLRAEALVAGADPPTTIYLDAVRAGQTVAALSAPVADGRAVFALDLDGAMVGTLELHAYWVRADGRLVRASRLVIVDAPRQVSVDVSADREAYRPGETAHLQIQTHVTSTVQPADQERKQAVLGIGVVDASVYALETMPPGFVRAYFLLEQELLERPGQGLDVPAMLDAEEEMRASQDVAARAAWAGAEGSDYTLTAVSTAAPEAAAVVPYTALANQIGLVVALLPLLLGGVVAQGLWLTGVLGRALRRVLVGILILFAASPVIAGLVGGVMFLLWRLLGIGAPIVVLVGAVALLAGLALHGWLRRDARVQMAAGLLVAYLALVGLLVALAARGGELSGLLLGLIAATFLLALAAVAALGQGLVLERWRMTGWATTALALLLIPLAIYLPFVPGAASDLTRTLGSPALYAGPVGWLTGCAAQVVEKTVVQTQVVVATQETESVEETKEAMPTSLPAPTASPPAAATLQPTLPPIPAEPYPLRQVFPETLYWDPEAVTDDEGRLTLDLPVADSITTWRLTALASTRDGELGVATYDLVVFQDFFVDLDLPSPIAQGETVTVTVTAYNYLDQAQTVRIEPVPAGWYTLVSPPQALTLPPGGVAAVTFTIRAEEAGAFTLFVTAAGEGMSDAVAGEVIVEGQ